jgi:ribosomal protein S18 acetylase RimI-like enzyme
MDIRFDDFEISDRPRLLQLVNNLYEEDPGHVGSSDEKTDDTIKYLTNHPDGGKIISFKDGDHMIGYSILINYWSNELGGTMTFIDELYIDKSYRNKNIGTEFLQRVAQDKSVRRVMLEVTRENNRTLEFYIRNGFKEVTNRFLYL